MVGTIRDTVGTIRGTVATISSILAIARVAATTKATMARVTVSIKAIHSRSLSAPSSQLHLLPCVYCLFGF